VRARRDHLVLRSLTLTNRSSLGAALLVTALAARAAAQPPAAPELPDLALDTFPAAAREDVAHASQQAHARPDDAGAAGTLGRVLQAWEMWDTAHAAYARAQGLAPRQFEWHYLDAVVLQRLARHAEAAERLREALRLSPDYLPARVKLADAVFEAGDFAESRRLFEALARDPATEPMGRFGLGRLAAAEDRHDEAIEYFQRAVELFPEWGAAHYALALSYRALGRRDAAREALQRHARYGPQWPALEDPILATVAAVRDDARAILSKGVRLAESGDLPAAIEAHENALARDPSLTLAHANLISLYGRTGDWARAEQHYKAAIASGGDIGDAHYDYGVLLGLQQRWDEAGEAYRRAIAINPQHARAYNNLGEVLERQRKPAEALDAYRRAAAAQPGFRLARFNVARLLLASGRAEEAIPELARIVEPRDAEAPRYLFALGAAHVHAGRKDAAIEWVTEAHELALQYGQKELAAAIERELARLK
jgi:tetratricopeptide (TPR) repeat protein